MQLGDAYVLALRSVQSKQPLMTTQHRSSLMGLVCFPNDNADQCHSPLTAGCNEQLWDYFHAAPEELFRYLPSNHTLVFPSDGSLLKFSSSEAERRAAAAGSTRGSSIPPYILLYNGQQRFQQRPITSITAAQHGK